MDSHHEHMQWTTVCINLMGVVARSIMFPIYTKTLLLHIMEYGDNAGMTYVHTKCPVLMLAGKGRTLF